MTGDMRRSHALGSLAWVASFAAAMLGCAVPASAQTARMPETAREVVARQVEAVNAHDVDAVVKFHAPDATMAGFPSGKVLAHGSAAIHALFANLYAKSPRFQLTLTRQILSGNVVINHYSVSNGPMTELVSMYEVKGGAIAREWIVTGASGS